MAFQARQRDPIFDAATQAVIERRGKELIGVGLVLLGLTIALIVGSYAPEDPPAGLPPPMDPCRTGWVCQVPTWPPRS